MIPERLKRFVETPGPKAVRYSASEVARIAGIARETVVAHIEKGWLAGNRDKHGNWRIRRRAIRRWVWLPQVAELIAQRQVDRVIARTMGLTVEGGFEDGGDGGDEVSGEGVKDVAIPSRVR